MRIWKIGLSPSNKDELWWKKGFNSSVMAKIDGKTPVDAKGFYGLVPKRPLKKDIFYLENRVLAISENAYVCLEDALQQCAQCLRIELDECSIWLINVLTVIDCLSDASIVDYSEGDRRNRYIRDITMYDFCADKAYPPLFKILGGGRRSCYCTDELVQKTVDCHLEGFRFVLVWDSRLEPGAISFRSAVRPPDYYIDSGKRGKVCLPGESAESFGKKLVEPERGCRADVRENTPFFALNPPVAATFANVPVSSKYEPYSGSCLGADIITAREAALKSLPDLPALDVPLADGPCDPLDSRVGGCPAMLPEEEWPLDSAGSPLCFLAQLNMADLSTLPGFPRQGLLRLFVGEEPEYGLDPNDMTAQRGFRALFAIDTSGAQLRPASEEAEDGLGWGEGPWAIRFGAPEPSWPDDFDFRTQEIFCRKWAALHPSLPVKCISDADRYASARSLSLDLAIEAKEAAGDPPAVQVGGYPSFVQADDRHTWEERYEKYDTLLLQLSSDHDRFIEIGDGGRMYFFIPSDKLAVGDFSDVMYWWDCM